MPFQVQLKSKEQWLGDLIRALKVNTDISDFVRGSDIATLLEAIASSQFEISVSALKILQSTDLDSLTGQQLDKKAQSILLPNGVGGTGRKPATQSSGPVTIGSSFTKVSANLYAGQPAPFAGSKVLYVNNASAFPTTGSIYLGRGTINRFEGPIPYSSVVNSGSYWTITLSSPITKNHLISDSVVLSQGGDRLISSGTTVQIPANNQSTAIQFTTTQDLLIPDGESQGQVSVICSQFGEVGNASLGSITEFVSLPFAGANVTNPTAFANGQSTESDESLRLRIKNYPATLSRGTSAAILAAVLGATDPVSGRTVQSAVVLDPIQPGDNATVFIDDGTGLEPTFGSQPYELLLSSASGQETRFRTAQFPITAAVAEGSESAPYVLQNGQSITVSLNGVVETYSVTGSNYQNLNAATAYEVVRDLNSQANIVGFRTLDGGTRIAMIDLAGNGEQLIVQSGTLQQILGFPTSTIRPIFVYKNSKLQSFLGHTATLQTNPRNLWSINSGSNLTNLIVIVDKVPVTFSLTDADFSQFGTTRSTATVQQYATVLGTKIPGVKFTVSGQILVWSSRNELSAGGSLSISTTDANGNPVDPAWIGSSGIWQPAASGGVLSDTGAPKDYSFNRFTGEINFSQKLSPGDKIEIASRDTRAKLTSAVASSGQFSLPPLTSTVGNARFVAAFDGQFEIRSVTVPVGATITPTLPDSTNAPNILRLTSNSTGLFANAQVGDWLYLIQDKSVVPSWGANVEGFYKVQATGFQKAATNQSYNGLAAQGLTFAGVVANTQIGTAVITVSVVGHGLSTGDLITVQASAPIGGISSGNLSVTNAPIIVIDANTFEYTALANATSTTGGTLAYVGTNFITVTHTSHGFKTGAFINTTVTSGFSGISSGNLSVTNAPIQVLSLNSYAYRASAAVSTFPMPSGGNIQTLTYVADTWIEFEASSAQMSSWTPLLGAAQPLSTFMVNIFLSTTQPQLVNFGNVNNLTVDEIVASINGQIQSGSAVKLSPQQFEIRSNDFTSGTAAILAVVGNASAALSTGTSTSLQYHVGYSQSANTQAGFIVVDTVQLPSAPASGYGTQTYLVVDHKFVDILDNNPNPTIQSPTSVTPSYPYGFEHLWLTGRQAGLFGRVYNNQTSAPYTGQMTGVNVIDPVQGTDTTTQTQSGALNRYSNYGLRFKDLNLNNNDKLVVQMDLDAVNKTVPIPLSISATIQDINAITGSGPGQVISFRLQDPNNNNLPFFDPTSVYVNFDLTDFKLLTKSVGLYRTDVSDRAMIIRSAAFGGQHRLKFSLRYATAANQAAVTVSHSNSYLEDDAATLNLVAVLPSSAVISGSTQNTGNYSVASSLTGTLYSMRLTAGSINSGNQYQPGNVLNISGSSALAGSYKIASASFRNTLNASATASSGSPNVTVTIGSHGLQTGDLISVATSSAIGGITAAQLTQSDTPVTVIDANNFSYVAGANATSNGSGTLDQVTYGMVTFLAPGNGGVSRSLFSAAAAPVASWSLTGTTFNDIATAINAYYPTFPVATATLVGTNVQTTAVTDPTYVTYPQGSAYSGSDMSGAFDYNSFSCKLSGEAGIWQYDSSIITANGIKATVQSNDPIFPTSTEASGTAYTPIGEAVYIVPTNTKTLQKLLNFNASSSLNILANIERIDSDSKLQISSQQDGSAGAVQITGVTANSISSFVEGNATESQDSTKVTILSADSKAMNRNSGVIVQNSIATELQRPYALTPTGSAITTVNTTDITSFFRSTNAIKYVQMSANVGRLIFLRDGKGPSQSEHLSTGNTIQFTNLGNGLVQVTSALAGGTAGTGVLSARVGDMMYIRPDASSAFTYDQRCQGISNLGYSDGTQPSYLGYPVVWVIDTNNVIIIAPNITNFTTITLSGSTASTDLVFMPAIWNEKNIRTNFQEGALFNNYINNGECYFLIKSLGSGLVSVWLQNSSAEATDSMKLGEMSVSTDDYAIFGSQFEPANQGTFRIVAHNGRNHMIIYNPEGGQDQILNTSETSNGGVGDRKWRFGPISGGTTRPIRIIDGESVKIGDKLRISTPFSSSSQWFNNTFIGEWPIVGIGYSAYNFSATLPASYSGGTFDLGYIAPYVDIQIPNAPLGITNSSGAYVDSFLIAQNQPSIGFVEGTPFTAVRLVAGTAVSPEDPSLGEVFLLPNLAATKMSSTFGTELIAMNKLGYSTSAFQGIDGYKIYSGLPGVCQSIIDGLPTNTVLYPGVKAAGTIVEVLTPLIKTISASLQVYPNEGVTLNSISDLVKSTVADYINGLGVGQPVIISEIVASVQALPGVQSVQVLSTLPAYTVDRITVASSEKPYVLNAASDIIIG